MNSEVWREILELNTANSYFGIQIWLLTVTTELTSERGLEEREL